MMIEYGKGWMRVPLADLDAVGGVVNVKNPEGEDVIITNAVLQVDAAADAACTVDAGIDDAGDTSNDTIFDGLNVHSATGVFDMRDATDNGTNGVGKALLWPEGYHLVVSKASGAAAGLKGYLHVEYIHAE